MQDNKKRRKQKTKGWEKKEEWRKKQAWRDFILQVRKKKEEREKNQRK